MLLVVVVPDFVAFEFALRSTDAAAMVVVGVDLFAQFVPLRTRKHFAHVAVPACFWHEFDGQAEIIIVWLAVVSAVCVARLSIPL